MSLDDGRVVEEPRERARIERRRHDQHAQVLAQRLLALEAEREAEIGVEAALVKLIEDARSRCCSSSGSDCSMRVRIPSVTTSMRVARLTRVSSRVRMPTVLPTGSPSRCAMRCATARAAMRRGSSIRSVRPASQSLSRRASGTMVLLPAPGGACSSTLRLCRQRVRQRRERLADRQRRQVGANHGR